jgi:hypothetical protein
MNDDTRTILRQLRESTSDLRAHWRDRLERAQLMPQEFSAMFPLSADPGHEPDKSLREALQAFDVGPHSFAQLPGLHCARWVLLNELNPVLPGTPVPKRGAASGPLVFTLICDGPVLEALDSLIYQAGPLLDSILKHCDGYPGSARPHLCLAYFRKYRRRSAYFFRDSRQLDPAAQPLPASAREIERALAMRQQFLELVIDNQGAKPAEVLTNFRTFRSGKRLSGLERQHKFDRVPGYPFALSPALEHPLEHERLWVRWLADLARARARRDARTRSLQQLEPPGLRGVHAKQHGLIEARFRVSADLPPALRHGVFAPGAEYTALVRPSNSNASPLSDLLPDARGLSIKLMDVADRGGSVLTDLLPDGIVLPHGKVTQDFLLVSHPTFFMKNARDFAILRSFVDARPDGVGEGLGLAASLATFALSRPRECAIFARTLLRWTRHPLAVEYHSMTAFLLGPERAVKFSVRPSRATAALLAADTLGDFAADCWGHPGDYLRAALQRTLDALPGASTLELEFAVHFDPERELPVEDPRIDWDKLGATRVVVATLSIAKQDATSTQRMAAAERLNMNPWHALAAHRPLGSLNRARLEAYLASAEERARADGDFTQLFAAAE